MITITDQSREFTPVEMYLMTTAPSVIVMKNVPDGTEIDVDGYLEFHDDGDGKKDEADVMTIIDADCNCYAFQSATLKRTIHDIWNLYKGAPFTIIKTSGISKKRGKEFINATLKVDVDSLKKSRGELKK